MAKTLPTIRAITLDENGTPKTVTIKMTVEQLADLTKIVGKLSPATGGTEGTSEFYDCAVGELFNRFWEDWEDGINSYSRGAEVM